MADGTGGRGRVIITGMGAVTPIGVGVPVYAASLRAGRSGVRRLPFRHPKMKSTVGAMVWPDVFDPATVMGEADLRRLPRLVPMAIAAAEEAMGTAGLGNEQRSSGAAVQQMGSEGEGGAWSLERSRRVGLILGTGAGGIDFTLDQFDAKHGDGNASLWTITNATHGNLAGELSIRLGLRGPSYCVSTGCASSSDAVGIALMMLRSGEGGLGEGRLKEGGVGEGGLDAMVIVGADAHVRWETLHGMELLRVISTREWGDREGGVDGEDPATASRPFDASRDGFVLGEGAWAVVLERASAAAARGAGAIAEVMGYAATCDAYHRVRPAPEMAESARAMRGAVADAGISMRDVEVIHYHGTGTRLNDALETTAVKLAFGDGADGHARRLAGSSCKGMIGHPQGASGLAALVATVAGLTGADGGPPFIPPTINLTRPDTEGGCDLDYTANRAAATSARTALVNCLAFGAKNSAVAVRAAERMEGRPGSVGFGARTGNPRPEI